MAKGFFGVPPRPPPQDPNSRTEVSQLFPLRKYQQKRHSMWWGLISCWQLSWSLISLAQSVKMHPKIALKKNFLNTKHEHKKTMKNFQLLKKWQHNSYLYPIVSSTIYIPYFRLMMMTTQLAVGVKQHWGEDRRRNPSISIALPLQCWQSYTIQWQCITMLHK